MLWQNVVMSYTENHIHKIIFEIQDRLRKQIHISGAQHHNYKPIFLDSLNLEFLASCPKEPLVTGEATKCYFENNLDFSHCRQREICNLLQKGKAFTSKIFVSCMNNQNPPCQVQIKLVEEEMITVGFRKHQAARKWK